MCKTFIIIINMPQLIPFFFVNQMIFNFFFILVLVYMFTNYILPRFVRVLKTRLHINQL